MAEVTAGHRVVHKVVRLRRNGSTATRPLVHPWSTKWSTLLTWGNRVVHPGLVHIRRDTPSDLRKQGWSTWSPYGVCLRWTSRAPRPPVGTATPGTNHRRRPDHDHDRG